MTGSSSAMAWASRGTTAPRGAPPSRRPAARPASAWTRGERKPPWLKRAGPCPAGGRDPRPVRPRQVRGTRSKSPVAQPSAAGPPARAAPTSSRTPARCRLVVNRRSSMSSALPAAAACDQIEPQRNTAPRSRMPSPFASSQPASASVRAASLGSNGAGAHGAQGRGDRLDQPLVHLRAQRRAVPEQGQRLRTARSARAGLRWLTARNE